MQMVFQLHKDVLFVASLCVCEGNSLVRLKRQVWVYNFQSEQIFTNAKWLDHTSRGQRFFRTA